MMARVKIELPSLLAPFAGGAQEHELEADTLERALERLTADHPALAIHLFDETGGLRRHVLCFHNRTNTRWLDHLAVPLDDGDTIKLMQAVSGG